MGLVPDLAGSQQLGYLCDRAFPCLDIEFNVLGLQLFLYLLFVMKAEYSLQQRHVTVEVSR